MMKSQLKSLFEHLGWRMRHENALSDVTWAACMACPSLQRAFVRFFFPQADVDALEAFEREYPQGGSRPDFYLCIGGGVYLIEVKVRDSRHHFGQYERDFGIPASHLGYIANYPLKREGYRVRTWEELYASLNGQLPADGEERAMWLGYLAYVETVCAIYKRPERMDLNGMYFLYAFMQELRRLVNRDTETYCSEWYDSRQDTHGGGNRYCAMRDGAAGCYFHLTYKQVRIAECWVWMGVYFSEPEPFICICFENNDGWGKPACDALPPERVEKVQPGRYATAPIYDGGLWFDLSKTARAEFQSAPLDRQVEILEAFMDEVVNAVGREGKPRKGKVTK